MTCATTGVFTHDGRDLSVIKMNLNGSLAFPLRINVLYIYKGNEINEPSPSFGLLYSVGELLRQALKLLLLLFLFLLLLQGASSRVNAIWETCFIIGKSKNSKEMLFCLVSCGILLNHTERTYSYLALLHFFQRFSSTAAFVLAAGFCARLS